MKGNTGPTGVGYQFTTAAGPFTTTSNTAVGLSGPSVTVDVGPSGLVAFRVKATVTQTGAGTANESSTGTATYSDVQLTVVPM